MIATATPAPQGSLFRPRFASATAYVAACEHHWKHGREEWPPATRDEMLELFRRHPERGRRYLPRDPRDLEAMGLPRTFGRPAEPFSESWREQFFATLQADAVFRAAVRALLMGAA